MAKLDLEFIVDPKKLNEGFVAGEFVEGQLKVTAHKDMQCNGLAVSLGWETSGSGNVVTDKRENKETLYEGNFLAGETLSYDFSLQIPLEGPFEFIGKELILFYYLEATADIPMAFDPVEKLQLRVIPAVPSEDVIFDSGQGPLKPYDLGDIGDLGVIPGLVLAAFLAGIITLFLSFILSSFLRVNPLFYSLPIFLLIFTIVVFLVLKNKFAQFKIEKPIFEIPSNVFNPGGIIPFGAAVTAKRLMLLNNISIKLICEEVTVSGSGTNKTSHYNEVFEVEKLFFEQENLDPGLEKKVMDQIEIPADAPFYFNVPNNQVTCKLLVRFDIAHCPDYTITKPIYIVPPGYKTLAVENPFGTNNDSDNQENQDDF